MTCQAPNNPFYSHLSNTHFIKLDLTNNFASETTVSLPESTTPDAPSPTTDKKQVKRRLICSSKKVKRQHQPEKQQRLQKQQLQAQPEKQQLQAQPEKQEPQQQQLQAQPEKQEPQQQYKLISLASQSDSEDQEMVGLEEMSKSAFKLAEGKAVSIKKEMAILIKKEVGFDVQLLIGLSHVLEDMLPLSVRVSLAEKLERLWCPEKMDQASYKLLYALHVLEVTFRIMSASNGYTTYDKRFRCLMMNMV